MEGNCGIIRLACLYVSKEKDKNSISIPTNEGIESWLVKNGIEAYPRVFIENDEYSAMRNAIIVGAAGILKSNIVTLRFDDNLADRLTIIHSLAELEMSVMIIYIPEIQENSSQAVTAEKSSKKVIDIWIEAANNSSLMVIISWLLKQSAEWSEAKIRMLRIIDNPEGKENAKQAMLELANKHRIKAEAIIISNSVSTTKIIAEKSQNSDAVFISPPDINEGHEQEWFNKHKQITQTINAPVIFAIGTGKENY